MVLSDEKIREYMRRLLLSRMRILCTHGFYGLLIMHMKFALDETCENVATDGVRMRFNPEFLDSISDPELDSILMQEIQRMLETIWDDEELADVWLKRLEDACEAIKLRDPSNARGLIPEFAARILFELKKPQTDWRTILNSFVQKDIVDYSFMPPDRRLDGDFFLPDFNEKDEKITDILFMVDTSGSMTDDMITAAYSEIKGAIDQFDGKLKGWLGFFDVNITKPVPFEDESELRIIKPIGGGGTDFHVVFDYIREHMQENPPASIIIFTDGYAPFPSEHAAMGIPVLWLLNNEEVNPPWGKVARITMK